MMIIRSLLFGLLAVALGGACDRGRREEAPGPAAEPAGPPQQPSLPSPTEVKPAQPSASLPAQSHMRDHYAFALAAHAAVVRGDLETARREARWLAEHPLPASVAGWEAPLVRQWNQEAQPMREEARQIAGAPDILTAAVTSARMATGCATCHESMKVVPAFAPVPQPVDASGAPARMRLHAWAADRMWDGLIGPSDASWRQGVEALAIAPLAEDQILTGATAVPEIVDMARRVRDEAAAASIDAPASIRAEIYGWFLGNCAACHGRLGVGARAW